MLRRFTFSSDPDITEEDAKHWCSIYSLRFLRFEGNSVIVKWDKPEDITVAELLGRARMLDLVLSSFSSLCITRVEAEVNQNKE